MIELPGYHIVQRIYNGSKTCIYRAVRLSDRQTVVVKCPKHPSPSLEEAEAFRHEHDILRFVQSESVIRPLGLEHHRHGPALLLEDIGGISIRSWLRGVKLDIGTFLRLAIRIAEGVYDLHRKRIIHHDINPSHIIITPDLQIVQLIDFRVASRLTGGQPLAPALSMKGTLPYMSPEQTGRTNRPIDLRTDVYSMGATFYEMLTDSVPFPYTEAAELVNAHLHQDPVPPAQLDPTIPQALSDIVLKCLAKTAEERYFSAYGLKADLELCLELYLQTGDIPDFEPGRQDVADRLSLPDKIYGRTNELNQLLETYARTKRGSAELVWIQGQAGIGKSFIVRELKQAVLRDGGTFCAGKSESGGKDVPFGPFLQAMRDLLRQLLSESGHRAEEWTSRLHKALGSGVQLISAMLPETEPLFGRPAEATAWIGLREPHHVHQVLSRLLAEFATSECPLVLFLDDLQWADEATVQLLQGLTLEPGSKHLLLLCGRRETGIGHDPVLAPEEAEKRMPSIQVHHLTVGPLPFEDAARWLADALVCSTEEVRPLTRAVLHRTGGNPFFIQEFVRVLQQENAILFDSSRGGWRWDTDRIERTVITENVVDWILGGMRRLTSANRAFLEIAACLGSRFDLRSLYVARGKPVEATERELKALLREGYFASVEAPPSSGQPHRLTPDSVYRFRHDRVHQAAVLLMDEETLPLTHLQVGKRLLLNGLTEQERRERLFSIVSLLNRGASQLQTPEEKYELSRLNLSAGIRANRLSAYESASRFLKAATETFDGNEWEERYDFMIALHKERLLAEYGTGRTEEADRLLQEAKSRSRNPADLAELYEIKLLYLQNRNRSREAIGYGLEGLKLLGVRMNKQPGRMACLIEYRFAAQALRRTPLDGGRVWPKAIGRFPRAAMRMAVHIFNNAYLHDFRLAFSAVCRIVRLTEKFGWTEVSPFGLMAFAIYTTVARGRTAEGKAYAEAALRLAEESGNPVYGRCYVLYAMAMHHWFGCTSSARPNLEKAFRASVEAGDGLYAMFASMELAEGLFFRGEPLCAVLEDMEERSRYLKNAGIPANEEAHSIYRHLALQLMERHTDGFYRFDDPEEELRHPETIAMPANRHYYWLAKLRLQVEEGSFEEALKSAEASQALLEVSTGRTREVLHHFYLALALSGMARQSGGSDRLRYRSRLARTVARLARYAEWCPDNFRCHYALAAAEYAGVCGRFREASERYAEAVEAASAGGFTQVAALACERTAEHLSAVGMDEAALAYRKRALHAYASYGALGRANELMARYPALAQHADEAEHSASAYAAAAASAEARADMDIETEPELEAVIGAVEALAGEIAHEQLIEKMLKLAMENAGAHKGVFLVYHGLDLRVQAIGTVTQRGVVIAGPGSAASAEGVFPATILQHGIRSREPFVLGEADRDERFAFDPYVRRTGVKSVLCMPILRQEKLYGLLYIENHLMKDAFANEDVRLIRLLAVHIAISIENAGLVSMQEERVTERTRELEESNRKLEEINRELLRMETSRRQLLSNISHDLGTPLTLIRGYVEALLDGVVAGPEQQQKYLQIIHTRVIGINRLIQDLFLLSKLELRKVTFYIAETDMCELMRRLFPKYELDIRSAGLVPELSVPPASVTASVSVDRDRIDQVLSNLVSNAIKHTPKGGNVRIRLVLADSPKSAAGGKKGREVRMSVEDTGAGIAKDDLDYIFDRFYTGSKSRTGQEGNGLGLAIAKEIIDYHGGRIWAESTIGEGTQIFFSIPLREEE